MVNDCLKTDSECFESYHKIVCLYGQENVQWIWTSPNHNRREKCRYHRNVCKILLRLRALKCVNKKAILKFSNVHNFWNEKMLNAWRRILEVDIKAQTRRRQSRRYRKTANDSGSINQCFSATAIANVKKMWKDFLFSYFIDRLA